MKSLIKYKIYSIIIKILIFKKGGIYKMKELALQVIQNLPDNVSDEEIAEALLLIGSIMKGYKQAEDGASITTEQLLKEIAKW